MRTLELSPEAADDLRAITRYSDRTWGRDRRGAYMAALVKAMARLRARDIGRPRPDIDAFTWSQRSGRHVILFERDWTRVRVLRVVHERRDVVALLTRQGD